MCEGANCSFGDGVSTLAATGDAVFLAVTCTIDTNTARSTKRVHRVYARIQSDVCLQDWDMALQ